MARWSSGQDGGLSRRKREFDSPTGHHVGMDYIPFKKPSHSAGLFSYHFVIPPFPHKTLQGKLLRGPCCRENERPGRMDCIPFKNSGKWLGFSHTISSFLLIPTKLCKANFCGGPAAGGKRTPRQDELHSIQKLRQMTGLFLYHFVIPPFPHKTLRGKLLRGSRCRGETNAPAG